MSRCRLAFETATFALSIELVRFGLCNVEIVFGLLQVFGGRDLFFDKQFRSVVCGLLKFDLGSRGSVGVLQVGKRFQIVGLGLIDVGRFKLGQSLALCTTAP